MARVEWTRTAPDDVEAVIAMMLCAAFPNALRVRPSQGDKGIDVFVPSEEGDHQDRTVFQVKSFSSNLTNSQKRQIKRSFERVVQASRDEGWRIKGWFLVMPLDLTTQNLTWLNELTANAGFACESRGLSWCDTMAAHSPKIIDYYLRDGKERLSNALNQLTALLARRQDREDDEPLAPLDVMGDLASIHGALNAHDPFYRYHYQTSDRLPSEADSQEPGLVAISTLRTDSAWIWIKIFAQSLAAAEERPVTAHLQITIPSDDHDTRGQFQKFLDYGAPVSLPEGMVSGSFDMPGGLGGPFRGGALTTSVASDAGDLEEQVLSLAMIDPDDAVVAETSIRCVERSSGRVGHRSLWRDKADLFTVELLLGDFPHGTANLKTEYQTAGRIPEEILSGLWFLAAMHAPNRFGVAPAYGPRRFDHIGGPDHAPRKAWMFTAQVADALTKIQHHAATRILMPAELAVSQGETIIDAAKLLSGEMITGEASGEFVITHDEPHDLSVGDERDFALVKALSIQLGDDMIPLGKKVLYLQGSALETDPEHSRISTTGSAVTTFYTGEVAPGRVLSARRDW